MAAARYCQPRKRRNYRGERKGEEMRNNDVLMADVAVATPHNVKDDKECHIKKDWNLVSVKNDIGRNKELVLNQVMHVQLGLELTMTLSTKGYVTRPCDAWNA